jgi:hypothetical protein
MARFRRSQTADDETPLAQRTMVVTGPLAIAWLPATYI